MPDEELISQYVDRASITSDTEFLLEQLQAVEDRFAALANARIDVGKAVNAKEIVAATRDAERANQDLLKSKKQLIDIELQQAKVVTEEAKARKLNAETADIEARAIERSNRAKAAAAKAAGGPVESITNPSSSDDEAAAAKKTGEALSDLNRAEAEEQDAARAWGERLKGTAEQLDNNTKESARLIAAKKQLAQAQSKENEVIQGYRVQASEANKAAKQQAVETLGMNDAYQKLVIRYNDAQRSAKNLSVEYGLNSEQAKVAQKEAIRLGSALKAIDQSVGQSQRNVGNYTNSISKAFGMIRQLAYILPGIGLAGIFNVIFEAIGFAAEKLLNFSDASTKINDEIAASFKKGGSGALQQVADIQLLYQVTQDLNISNKQRQIATKELTDIIDQNNKLTGDHVKLLTDENGILAAQPDLIKKVSEELLKQARTKAVVELLEQSYKALISAQTDSTEAALKNLSTWDKFTTFLSIGGTQGGVGSAFARGISKGAADAQEKLNNLQKFIKSGLEDGTLDLSGVFKPKAGEEEAVKAQRQKFFDGILKQEAADAKKLSEITDLNIVTRLNQRQIEFDKELSIIKIAASIELQNESDKLAAVKARRGVTAIQLLNAQNEFNTAISNISNKEKQDITLLELNRDRDLIGIRQTYLAKQKDIDTKANEDSLKGLKKHEEDLLAAQKAYFDRSENYVTQGHAINVLALENATKAERDALDKRFAAGQISEKAYQLAKVKIQSAANDQKAKLDADFAADIDRDQLSAAEKQLAEAKKHGVDTSSLEAAIATLRVKINEDANKRILDDQKEFDAKQTELLQARSAAYKELESQAVSFVNAAINRGFDARSQSIQHEIDLLEERKQKDIEVANQTITNAQDRAAALTSIDIRAAAEKDRLERQQRKVEADRAKFQKVSSLFNIAIDTVQKVAAIKAQIALLTAQAAGNPFLFALLPLAAAQIPLVIGAGAAAAAAVAIQKIPQYKSGVKDKPSDGWAILGDGGKREAVVLPDRRAFISESRSTPYYLPRGTDVYPDADAVMNKLFFSAQRLPMQMHGDSSGDVASTIRRETRELVKAVKNKKEVTYKGTHAGVLALHQYSAHTLKYISEQIHFKP